MGKVRHVDWYHDEWISGTVELGNAERGLYVTAVSLIYSQGGPITRGLLRAACRSEHGNAFNRQLEALIGARKLIETDGKIFNKRCETELEKANNRTTKARENGPKGGRPPKDYNAIAKPDGFRDEKLTTNLPTTNLSSEGSREPSAAVAAPPPAEHAGTVVPFCPPEPAAQEDADPKRELYRIGKMVLGQTGGGQITKLLAHCDGDVDKTMHNLRLAEKAENPREYVGAILRGDRAVETDWEAYYAKIGLPREDYDAVYAAEKAERDRLKKLAG